VQLESIFGQSHFESKASNSQNTNLANNMDRDIFPWNVQFHDEMVACLVTMGADKTMLFNCIDDTILNRDKFRETFTETFKHKKN